MSVTFEIMCTSHASWSQVSSEKSYNHGNKHAHGSGAWHPLMSMSLPSHSKWTRCKHLLSSFRTLSKDPRKNAKLMFQLVTTDPNVKRVLEAGDGATADMSRLRALETSGEDPIDEPTSTAKSFRSKEAMECKPHVWSGEKNSERFTAFQNENGTAKLGRGALSKNAEGRGDRGVEGTFTEVKVKVAAVSQETVCDFNSLGKA